MSDEFVEYSTKALDGVRKAGSTEPVEVLEGEEARKVRHYPTPGKSMHT